MRSVSCFRSGKRLDLGVEHFAPHPHARKRNISATLSGVFISCPRGSFRDGLSVIRSSFICSLLS